MPGRGVQGHQIFGDCDEHPLHHFPKRILAARLAVGDPAHLGMRTSALYAVAIAMLLDPEVVTGAIGMAE